MCMRLLGVAPDSDWWRRCQPPECPKRKSTRECCIGLICRPLAGPSGLLGTHCAIEKTSCDGDRVVYELLREPPEVDGAARVGGEGSMIYAIRNAQYATGVDRRYWTAFRVCYPCDADTPGLDPVACRCVTDGMGRSNDVGEYPVQRPVTIQSKHRCPPVAGRPCVASDGLAFSLRTRTPTASPRTIYSPLHEEWEATFKASLRPRLGIRLRQVGTPRLPTPMEEFDARGERYE